MPVIPIYKRQMSIPGEAPAVPANIGAAGIVGESIAGLGRTGLAVTDEIVNVIARRNEEMRQRNINTVATDLSNKAALFLNDQKRAYDQTLNKLDAPPLDPAKEVSNQGDQFNENLSKHLGLDKISDPDLIAKVKNILSDKSALYKDGVAAGLVKANKNLADKTTIDAVQIAVQEARDGGDFKSQIDSITKVFGDHHAFGTYDIETATRGTVKAHQQVAIARFDGRLARGETEKAIEELKNPEYRQYLPEEDYRRLMEKAKTLNEKKIQEEKEMTAYVDASGKWPDAKQAMVEVLKPEFMKKHGLTINQAQNIAQSFNAIGAQKERDDKDRQDANLDAIRKVAINDPARALKIIQTSEDVDPKEALALQRATESHIRQMSLMSTQEKSLRMDLEDKIKTAIILNIRAGGYKSEQELTNAVIAEGLTNTSIFIKEAIGLFEKVNKSAVNHFDLAGKDWDRLISTSKSTKRKRELQDMKSKVLESLNTQMKKEKLDESDPKVSELYRVIRKEMTDTWVTKAIDSIFSGSSGDSFVAPTPGKNLPPAPVLMDEATARKKLEERGVKGAAQDEWIKRYREEGVIK